MEIKLWAVVDGDEVMSLYTSEDEAERATHQYYDAVVQGPFNINVGANNEYNNKK